MGVGFYPTDTDWSLPLISTAAGMGFKSSSQPGAGLQTPENDYETLMYIKR